MIKNRTIIIAEAGVNHNGSIDVAKKLIDVAFDAGADYVKFQTFKSELNISKKASKAEYQKKNTQNNGETQLEMAKKLELSFHDFSTLKDYCNKNGVGFLSTGFDSPSIDFLNEMDIDFFKIPSGEITDKPYLEYIASKGKPIVMSTGMADLGEIEAALKILIKNGISRNMITILHCNTEYPTPLVDVNLKAMLTIRNAFNVKVGYSDHTLGIEVPIAAVALGASVIEKHFTLDRSLPGPDHSASLEPIELKKMILAIRNIELALSGNGLKEPSKSERNNKTIARKSVHLKTDIAKGEKISENHLIMKRPGDGISPMLIDLLLGKKAKRHLKADDKLDWTDLE